MSPPHAERDAREDAPTEPSTVTNGKAKANARERFAMVPESVILGELPDVNRTHHGSVALFALLELQQGTSGRPARNLTRLAEALGVQPRTIRTWVKPLVDAGYVEFEQDGFEAATLRIICNPAHEDADCTRPQIDRHSPPKQGTRTGHRGRRGKKRKLPTAARTSRASTPADDREERGQEARTSPAPYRALQREERAPVQVSKGLTGLEAPARDKGKVVGNCRNCAAIGPVDDAGDCKLCERF